MIILKYVIHRGEGWNVMGLLARFGNLRGLSLKYWCQAEHGRRRRCCCCMATGVRKGVWAHHLGGVNLPKIPNQTRCRAVPGRDQRGKFLVGELQPPNASSRVGIENNGSVTVSLFLFVQNALKQLPANNTGVTEVEQALLNPSATSSLETRFSRSEFALC